MKKFFPLLGIFLTFIIYLPSLKYGFSQDDFIHLSASHANSVGGFLNFFNPFYKFPDIFFFRPLTTQVYFFVNQSIFGLNPLPFHLEALLVHLMNSWLFFLIIKKIWKNNNIALISALFYGVSAIHFLSLYYISAFQEIGRTLFIFLSIIAFFNYQKKHVLWLIFSVVSFILALLSKETAIILPLLFVALEVLRKKEEKILGVTKNMLTTVAPFIMVAIIYVGVRLAGFQSIFNQGDYKTTFSILDILQNLKWYILWSFGLPEVLSSYPSLRPNSLFQFSKDLPFGEIVLILTAVSIIITIFLTFKSKLSLKVIIASLLIFLIPLIPVLVLKDHRYPQYLDLPFLGFLPILAIILWKQDKIKKIIGIFGIIIFIPLQIFSLSLSEKTHWTTHRANVALYYQQNLKKTYLTLPKNTTLVFTGTQESAHELQVALAYKYAVSLWYPGMIKDVKYGSFGSQRQGVVFYPITKY